MNFHFNQKQLLNKKENEKREWALTNGIGGYAGGNILGDLNRTHQGYLIASLHPPVERFLVFTKTIERLVGADFHLTDFNYDGTVCFSYEKDQVSFTKHISMVQGENTVAVGYHITNKGEAATISITPLMNYREHSDPSTEREFAFHQFVLKDEVGFMLIPQENPEVEILLALNEGTVLPSEILYDTSLRFATDIENEETGRDNCYTPYNITIDLPANSTKDISLICHVEGAENISQAPELNTWHWDMPVTSSSAFEVLEDNKKYLLSLIEKAQCKDEFSEILTIAANQFLSYRQSSGLTTVLAGLPWFTDWGRDTMIAFTGLVLSTGRFDKAEEILQTFAQYVDSGMIPNMFPDDGQEPLYNTVDASLWYFYAVHKYLEYNNTPEAYAFIQEKIYPALKEIQAAYEAGTKFSIYMEEDGLIHAGGGLDQVTWMDVRVGEWVVTPRHGKPVEINALWYNALKVMENLSKTFGEENPHYSQLSEQVKSSFCEKFWNEADGCLYDVIDGDEKDASIRPNQIYALSLPYTMLDKEKEASILNVVQEKLFVGVGLRSLDPAHEEYHPIYVGALPKRDAAYHQGTAWGFLLGGFITAYAKVHGPSEKTSRDLLSLIAPVNEHFYENCIGSICEIFDGNAPHLGRGCYAQAWSVGETLRAYKEDILPYLNIK